MRLSVVMLLLFLSILGVNAQITTEKVLIHSTVVLFDYGEANIREDAISMLDELIEVAKDKSPYHLRITAHTDSIGSIAANLRLSKRRAESVKQFLLDGGLSPENVEVLTLGEDVPFVSNSSAVGRQENRRAQVELLQSARVFKISGRVLDQETAKGVQAHLMIRGKDRLDSLETDMNGYFQFSIPLGEVIGIDTWSRGYFATTKMLKAIPEEVKEVTVALQPIKVGSSVDIDNLYFVGGKDVLLKESQGGLLQVLKFMEINKNVAVEIAGHVNKPHIGPVSRISQSFTLSLKRAVAVYNYLVDNGVSPDRLSYKGYGNWEMRYPKAKSAAEQRANRRVEIRIVSVD